MTVPTAEADDDETAVVATNTTTAALATLATTGRRYADSSKSMSSRTNSYYGVQFYAPPVVHGTAADAFGRQLQQHQQHQLQLQQHHLQRNALQQPSAAGAAYRQRGADRTPWEQAATVMHADGAPILQMNPLLQLQQAYDDPSTAARYAPPKPLHRAHRIVKYAEPAAAAVAYAAR